MSVCSWLPDPHYPLPFLQTRPESSNFRVTSMCKFSPRTFYLRIPECDILCIRVPKINNLLRCVTDSHRLIRTTYLHCRRYAKHAGGAKLIYNFYLNLIILH